MEPEADPLGFEDSDPIEPVSVRHSVDDIIIDGRIEQTYNFIDYSFESPAGQIRARAYLNSAHEVAIYPPVRLARGQAPELGEDWITREAIVRYLARRFIVIKELGLRGPETIWMANHAPRFLQHRGLALSD